MITCTTLRIMTPHVREFPTVQRLLDHLADIHYLDFVNGRGFTAREGVNMQAVDDVTATSYIISQALPAGQRAHRIEMERGHVAFERCMLVAGVGFHAIEAMPHAQD